MRSRWLLVVGLVSLLATACVASQAPICGDGRVCPVGSVCDDLHGGCIAPAQLTACEGSTDSAACTLPGGDPGLCRDEVCLRSTCGDGAVVAPEQCDGIVPAELADCTAHGFHQQGVVGCTADCQFDRSVCRGVCGDGEVEGGELCEPGPTADPQDDLLAGRDCRSLGYHQPAGLACSAACTLDVAGCSEFCGDSVINGDEDCDGSALGAAVSCSNIGFYGGGVLACDPTTCSYDTSGCLGYCGDGLIGGSEVCDPGATPSAADDALGSRTCTDFGYYQPGGLRCSNACTFDIDACVGRCGDGVLDTAEDCDDADTQTPSDDLFAGDCTDLGYYDETTIACTPQCGFDDAGCTGRCGDRDLQLAEACDSAISNGDSCVGFGFDAGALVCGGSCAPDLSGCLRAWTLTNMPNSPNLSGAWAAGPDDITVVGYSGIGADVVYHYDGTGWSPMVVPFSTILYDVWGSATNDRFAVGAYGVIFHYNGTTWTEMTSGTGEQFEGVSGINANDVYAVGRNGTILHYNGTAWAPIASGTSANLFDVWVRSATDVFVVGDGGTILRGNTSGFSPMTSNTTATLFTVWGSGPNDVFAGGVSGTLAHWNGLTWTTQTYPTVPYFSAITGTAPDDVYALDVLARVMHWNGESWIVLPPLPGGAADALAIAPGDLLVVGGGGAIVRGDGSGWVGASGVSAQVRSIGNDGTTAYAVGNQAPILAWDGDGWVESAPVRPGEQLWDVWGASPTDVFAVGAYTGASIRRFNGTLWSDMATSATAPLHGVWGSSATNVFAVGEAGTIVRYNGSTWTAMTSGTSTDLSDVWGRSANDVIAVGVGGTIRRFDGAVWTAMTSPTSQDLFAIWGTSTELYAAGGGGTLLHYDGSAWTVHESTTENNLYAVWGRGPHHVYAAGEGGTVVRWDGLSWSAMRLPTTNAILALGGAGDHTLAVTDLNATVSLLQTCTAAEQACSDGRDDDCDGRIDCGDGDCATVTACTNGGSCQGSSLVTCGTTTTGSTLFGAPRLDRYACDPWSEPARERVHRVIRPSNGSVTVSLRAQTADLDVIVLRADAAGGCDPRSTGCVRASSNASLADEVITFDAIGGAVYYVVVDGPGTSLGSYALEVACP